MKPALVEPRPHRRWWLPAVAAALAAAVALAGCGVPADGEPQALPENDVPFNLLEPVATSTTTTTVQVATKRVNVYYIQNECLVERKRRVTQPVSAKKVVDALLDPGPDEEEQGQGIRSALLPGFDIQVGTLQQGVLTINLPSEFFDLPQQEQIRAWAQLIYTATGVEEVDAVQFTREGQPIEVLLPEAIPATGPVSRQQFPQFPACQPA